MTGEGPLSASRPNVQRFAIRFFELAGARTELTTSGLRVELTQDQLELLEGRPAWGFRPPSDGLTTFYFAFDEDEVAVEDRVEQVGVGSFRLQQLCDASIRLGALGRAFVRRSDVPGGRFWPYMVFHFLVTYVGHDVRERLGAVAVDLVTGEAFPCPPLSGERLDSTASGEDAEFPRLTVGQAHEHAVETMCDIIADEDPSWFHDKWNWIENELQRLYAYLQRSSDELHSEDAVKSLRDARLTELRELNRPRVELRAVAATLLYAPVVIEPASGRMYNPVFDKYLRPD